MRQRAHKGKKKSSIPIKASWAAFSHISWLSNPDVYCWKCTRLKNNCRLITLCQEAAQLFFKFATIAILKVAMYLPSFKTVLEDFISGKHNWDKPFHQNKTAEIRCFLKSYFRYFGTFRSLDLCWSLITIYETATTEGWIYAPCCYSVCLYIGCSLAFIHQCIVQKRDFKHLVFKIILHTQWTPWSLKELLPWCFNPWPLSCLE